MLRDTHDIQDDVRAALDGDARIRHPELIAIFVDRIGTVVLQGAVDSPPERRAAAHAARQVDGVFDVIVDDIEIHPPVTHRRDDDEIRVAALQRLIADPRIHADHIRVRVSHGQVTLSGYVREPQQRAAAAEDAAGVRGVVEVVDEIKVA